MRLTKAARETIKNSGLTIAGYTRHWFYGSWGGDACGCPDDRCKDGFHHYPDDECGCLHACISIVFEERARWPWYSLDERRAALQLVNAAIPLQLQGAP